MINPTKQENLKVESSIETEKKEIKIPKIKNEKIGCNNSEFKGSNNPELIKSQKRKKKKLIGQMKLKRKIQKRFMQYIMDQNQEYTSVGQKSIEQ